MTVRLNKNQLLSNSQFVINIAGVQANFTKKSGGDLVKSHGQVADGEAGVMRNLPSGVLSVTDVTVEIPLDYSNQSELVDVIESWFFNEELQTITCTPVTRENGVRVLQGSKRDTYVNCSLTSYSGVGDLDLGSGTEAAMIKLTFKPEYYLKKA
jgi:hypothetical protein